MKTVLRCLVIGVLVAGIAAGCGDDSGSGDKPKPESSNSQGNDGGYGGY